ncbi:protein of unknown function [Ruminococcaceae bacterium BL-4]|nr:protein of unknown function [Ruminococcaceae bacterium BL-4]
MAFYLCRDSHLIILCGHYRAYSLREAGAETDQSLLTIQRVCREE